MEFAGKDVVVTGGAGALGRAVVARLEAAGAACHVADVAASGAGAIDLADEAAVGAFYDGLPDLWASIHCAGGFRAEPIAATDASALLAQLSLNAVTCFTCCRAAIGRLRRAGRGGRIVNVAARPGLVPSTGAGMSAYAASKAAVVALTQALAEEVAAEGILVNAVAPSILDTPANRAAMPRADFARWPKVEEVAEVIAFLASPNNMSARGAVVPVYGRS